MATSGTRTCPKCGKEYPGATKWCPADGAPLGMSPTKTCPKCLNTFPSTLQACPNDGTQLQSTWQMTSAPTEEAASIGQRFGGFLVDYLLSFLLIGILSLFIGDIGGRSIGKAVAGTKVVRMKTGESPGLWGLVRFIFRFFPLYWITILFRNDRRGIHDLVAGTQVIDAG